MPTRIPLFVQRRRLRGPVAHAAEWTAIPPEFRTVCFMAQEANGGRTAALGLVMLARSGRSAIGVTPNDTHHPPFALRFRVPCFADGTCGEQHVLPAADGRFSDRRPRPVEE